MCGLDVCVFVCVCGWYGGAGRVQTFSTWESLLTDYSPLTCCVLLSHIHYIIFIYASPLVWQTGLYILCMGNVLRLSKGWRLSKWLPLVPTT